jgi:hypothetical protein
MDMLIESTKNFENDLSINTSDNFLERVEEVDKRAIYQLG